MDRLLDIIRLMRVVNCLMAFAGVWLGAYLTWLHTVSYGPLMASLAAFCACAAGNILNDIVDIEADRINRPERVLVRGTVSVGYARFLAILFACLSLVLALATNWAVLYAVMAALVLLTAYNLWLQRVVIAGNVTIALLSSLVFMTGGWAVDYKLASVLPGPLIPAAFSFLFHLVREILKDAEDVEGDKSTGTVTLPQMIGVPQSILVALVAFLILAVLTYIPIIKGWFGSWYEIITVYCVDLPILALLIFIWGNPSPKMLRAGSIALKIGMVLGMTALFVG